MLFFLTLSPLPLGHRHRLPAGRRRPRRPAPALQLPHRQRQCVLGGGEAGETKKNAPLSLNLRPLHSPLHTETPAGRIEAAFREFTTRPDVAVVLVTQPVAEEIRPAIAAHTAAVPAILEIPSKDTPYQPDKDAVLARVRHLLGGEGAAAGRA